MAALLSGMVVAVTHAAAVYIEELFHAVDYGWSTIELLQKTQKKQAKFEAEERPKRGRAPKAAVVTGTHHFGIFFLVGRGIQSSGRN